MVKQLAAATLPTDFGPFELQVYEEENGTQQILMLFAGDSSKAPLIRVHSACATSEIFHANNCDCRAQLDMAIASIARHGAGAIVYLNQEGRGHGLVAKLRTMPLIDAGLDPDLAFRQLGYLTDARNFDVAAEILKAAGVTGPIILLTNNPAKVRELEKGGIVVAERRDCYVPPANPLVERDQAAKRDRLGYIPPTGGTGGTP